MVFSHCQVVKHANILFIRTPFRMCSATIDHGFAEVQQASEQVSPPNRFRCNGTCSRTCSMVLRLQVCFQADLEAESFTCRSWKKAISSDLFTEIFGDFAWGFTSGFSGLVKGNLPGQPGHWSRPCAFLFRGQLWGPPSKALGRRRVRRVGSKLGAKLWADGQMGWWMVGGWLLRIKQMTSKYLGVLHVDGRFGGIALCSLQCLQFVVSIPFMDLRISAFYGGH